MAENRFDKSGILLVNKPTGISSNTVVNIVKHALGAKKCGHLGTLDLEGEGLLPVTVNSATKLFDYFLSKDKTYETIFVFGYETDTLDLSGQIIKTKFCDISLNKLEEKVLTMLGKQNQMPPLYSAKKVNGKVAYKEARKGEKVELRPKEIEIYSMKVLSQIDKNTFKFEILCSSGTYIRSVCRDLAEKLGTYGSMQCILRTRCGGFHLKDAYTLEEIKSGNFTLIGCESVFDYQEIEVTKFELEKLLNGVTIRTKFENGTYKLFVDKTFFGLGEVFEHGLKISLRLM